VDEGPKSDLRHLHRPRAVQTWSRLHGFVSLEIAGSYASMGSDPDALFELELSSLGR
jgi:hypothetical protein